MVVRSEATVSLIALALSGEAVISDFSRIERWPGKNVGVVIGWVG